MTTWILILSQARRRPLRLALCSIGVAIGVAVGLFVLGYATSVQAGLQEAGWVRGSDLTLGFLAGGRGIPRPFRRQALADLAERPEVRESAAMGVTLWSLEGGLPLLVYGLEPGEFLWRDFLNGVESAGISSDATIFLGRVAARRLELSQGSEIQLGGQTFTVAGVFDAPSPLDSAAAILPLATWQKLLDQGDQISFLQVRLRENLPSTAKDALRQEIENSHAGLSAVPSGEFGQTLRQLQTAETLAWAMALIALLAGLSGVFNTVRMNLWERRAEIALLSALGWGRWRIHALLSAEGLLPATLGIAIGAGMVFGLWQLLELASWPAEFFHPSLSWKTLALMAATVLGLALLGAFPTIWRASHPSARLLANLN